MNAVKALAIDLDGTLLNESSNLTPRTVRTLQEFASQGGIVVLATGRWRAFTVDVARQLNCVSYLVCSDGRIVLKRSAPGALSGDGWEPLSVNLPKGEDVARLIRWIHEKLEMRCHFGVMLLDGARRLASSHMFVQMIGESESLARVWLAKEGMEVPTDLEQTLCTHLASEPVALLRCLPDRRGVSAEQLIQQVKPALDNLHHSVLWTASASQFTLDDGTGGLLFQTAGFNKARGLQIVSQELSWAGAIEGQGWLAFGDEWNDVEMLSWAEFSVAPGNSTSSVARAAAKEISSLTNDEDFIAAVVEAKALRNRLARI